MSKKSAKRSALTKFSLVAKSEGMTPEELEKFCAENGVSFAELQSWRDLSLSAMENSGEGKNRGGYRENNSQRLSLEETASIIENFTREEYRNLPLNIAHAKLMDQGIYIASPSTCERVMKAYYQGIGRVADRNIVRRKRPEYSAR